MNEKGLGCVFIIDSLGEYLLSFVLIPNHWLLSGAREEIIFVVQKKDIQCSILLRFMTL